MKTSSRSLYVRAAVVNHSGTALMRQIDIPTLLVEVPPSVINLKGFVVAGQIFWHDDSKWNVSRCLMCFKDNTSLEMMMCDGNSKTVGVNVQEVYIAPSHIVRSVKEGITPDGLRGQLNRDKANLPLVANTEPLLNNFLEYKVELKQRKDIIKNVA
mmetsp:Transcript_28500/g.39683  ORF Transcript_28500/g.39683 Transcript_28500/m.39683 type:complete len:156 (-) Transcript_28500:637-1104(-)